MCFLLGLLQVPGLAWGRVSADPSAFYGRDMYSSDMYAIEGYGGSLASGGVSSRQLEEENEESEVVEVETAFQPKSQISTILYTGLVGGVLGLSTLSFYRRPQDRLSHIAIGFGAGIILGAIWVTWTAARSPKDNYQYETDIEYEYEEESRLQWSPDSRLSGWAPPLSVSYTWNF